MKPTPLFYMSFCHYLLGGKEIGEIAEGFSMEWSRDDFNIICRFEVKIWGFTSWSYLIGPGWENDFGGFLWRVTRVLKGRYERDCGSCSYI